MKNIVTKQLEHIPITVISPSKITIQFCPIHNRTQFRQEPEQPCRFDFFCQFSFNHVVMCQRRINLGVKSCSYKETNQISLDTTPFKA